MSDRDAKLESLGYALNHVPAPAAAYVPVVIDGNTAYASGTIPIDGPNGLRFKGPVPSVVNLADARQAAALCAANLLRAVRAEIGSLDRIERVLKLEGFVYSDPTFTDQHLVINGASELMFEVLGDAGRHARAAVGAAALPLGASVEVAGLFRIRLT